MQKQYTKTLLGEDARIALKKGIDQVYAPVSVTMGAKGRNSVFNEFGHPKPTNDGVSIARRIFPYDEFERVGSELIKQAAEQTVREAGDGTTGSIVVAHALIEGGMEAIKNGKDPMALRVELEEAKNHVIEAIKKVAIPVKSREDILNVARISVEDEEMAQMVADAVEKAGKHGAVIVEEGSGYGLEKEEVQGYHWDRGYVSPYMVTNPEKDEAILEDCAVIVTDRYINLNKDLMQTMNECKAQGAMSALVICEKMEGELLQSLIINKVKGIFPTVVVSKPPTLEELEDIAVLTNSTAVTKDKGIKQINWGHIGKAKRVIVGKDKTTIICDGSPALEERVKLLGDAVKKEEDDNAKELLIARLAKLSDGMVLIRVGAKTEAERRYKKDKMDDAVSAAKAATDGGIVEGAGATLYRISDQIENEVMKAALEAPYKKILENAGIEPKGFFFNVKTGKQVKDLMKEGIIDPAKVQISIVTNAVSLAGTFLTIDSIICSFTEETGKE